jgi:hypothetical protein
LAKLSLRSLGITAFQILRNCALDSWAEHMYYFQPGRRRYLYVALDVDDTYVLLLLVDDTFVLLNHARRAPLLQNIARP